ncbi:response regulator [Desulfopila sp. IMCC35008]|uniref:ATP-binding response regulator n=1 Tax=Desulfopila sp. IMCC35008 TaxID=2653858 RepID=UPI0013D6B105|nr:response regulator [Desulfopila sp. IMCC35008]
MTTKTLVVDNNPVLLRAVSAFLEREGCVVTTATNGLEALNVIKEDRPDIIFTDLVMPLVGGEQLCKIVRNTPEFKSIFLVVVSGIVLEDLENILSAEYYDLCIAKGTLKDLREHIHEALERFLASKDGENKHGDTVTTRIPEGLRKSNIAMELLSERRHLKTILESLHEGIIELDKEGTVVSANYAALSILEVREESIVGKSYSTFPWPEYAEEIKRWVKSRVVDKEKELIVGEEDPIHFKGKVITLTFIPVNRGETVFSVCILRDITRQYRAEMHERELDNAMGLLRKMESLSSMAGGVAHDFNNLLTVICGNLDLVMHQKDMGMPKDQLDLIAFAHTAAYKAVDLARKISHSSPFGIVSHFETDLEELVSGSVQSFNRENNSNCHLNVPQDKITVKVDQQQMHTAIENVLQNSLEASDSEFIDIDISIKTFEEKAVISGQYIPEGSYACVAITDKGRGIIAKDLMKVFDPYYSTKQRGASKGMGLGLTVVYSTMRNHSGYALVESEVGKGTQVSLLLPVSKVEKIAKGLNYNVNGDRKILLVEQDVQARQICKTILEFIGWTVFTDEDPDRLSEIVFHDEGDESCVRLIFISKQYFDRAEFQQFLQFAKGVAPAVDIVVTGLPARDQDAELYCEQGVNTTLTLPYTFEGIKKVLGELCLMPL